MQWPSLLKPTILGFAQFVLCVYAVVSAFSPKPVGLLEDDKNTICPRDTICSQGKLELVSLGISRLTAFWMYAPLVLVFLTKCHALRCMLHSSAVSVFVPFCDEHNFHMTMGKYIVGASFIHTIFHLVRWGVQSNLEYSWSTVPGRTGWIAVTAMTFVVVPMSVPRIKQRLSFEMRKGLHYFCIVAGICLACHAPQGYTGWVMGICTTIYVLDLMWRKFCMTFKCISPDFVPLGDAVQITFKAPTMNFAASGGFVLVCVPSINRWQWHPFTVFPSATVPGHWCILVGRAGNWTEAVYKAVEKKTVGPIWIQGCFPSSFSTAEDFDNLVLVAAGTGITNALSTIQKLEGGRKLNVIWVCRQASLINYYVPSLAKNIQGFTLIYYTGKSKDDQKLIENTFGTQVLFFRKRPDYMKAISSIIIGTESGEWIPDKQVEFADEFYRLVSPHASWDIGYIDVFHLMRLVFNRDNSGDTMLHRSAIQQLYKAMTPPEQHTPEKMDNFVNSFEWDDDGAINMDRFVGGMRRLSSEDNNQHARNQGIFGETPSGQGGRSEAFLIGDSPADSGSMPVPQPEPADLNLAQVKFSGPDKPASQKGVDAGPHAVNLKRQVLDGIHMSMPDAAPGGIEGGLCFFQDMKTGAPNSAATATGAQNGAGVRYAGIGPGSATLDHAEWHQPLSSSSSKRLLPAIGAPDKTQRFRDINVEFVSPEPAPETPPASFPPTTRCPAPLGGVFGDKQLGRESEGTGRELGDSLSGLMESEEPLHRAGSDAGSDYAGEGTPSFVKKTRRWSVAGLVTPGPPATGLTGSRGRRGSVVGSLHNFGRRMSQTLLGGETGSKPPPLPQLRAPAAEAGVPPNSASEGDGGSVAAAASASFRRERFRGKEGGAGTWSTLGNVFGSAKSSGTVISADGSLNGRAWPPRNWRTTTSGASFKQRGPQATLKRQQTLKKVASQFNLQKKLARTQTVLHSERSERLGKCVEYVNALDGDRTANELSRPEDLSRWEVLYCGGASKTVTDLLEEVTSFLGVTLKTEQFNW